MGHEFWSGRGRPPLLLRLTPLSMGCIEALSFDRRYSGHPADGQRVGHSSSVFIIVLKIDVRNGFIFVQNSNEGLPSMKLKLIYVKIQWSSGKNAVIRECVHFIVYYELKINYKKDLWFLSKIEYFPKVFKYLAKNLLTQNEPFLHELNILWIVISKYIKFIEFSLGFFL